MGKMNTGHSAFSSGPELTQAVPTAQHVDTIPTMYGIPHMSLDSVFAEDVKLHPAHYEPSESVLGRYKRQAEEQTPKKAETPPVQAKDENPDSDEGYSGFSRLENMERGLNPTGTGSRKTHHQPEYDRLSKIHNSDPEARHGIKLVKKDAIDEDPPSDDMMPDAHPIKPFHDVLRSRGFKPHHSERQGETRVNHYHKENPGGGEHDRVELHHNQGRGPEFGSTNSITHSGDPEATAPRVNNSPEKLDRNIHAQSYRAPEGGVAPKHKPSEIREYAKKIKGDEAMDSQDPKFKRSDSSLYEKNPKPKKNPEEFEPRSHAEAEQMEERHGPRGDEY